MNAWEQLREKQQAEVNAFPIHFAFGIDQINRKIAELHLDPEHYQEQICGIGAGGFVLKQDYPALIEMFKRHKKEREDAIAADPTGDGFIYDMFLTELVNHEYGYTVTYGDTLEALGYSIADIEADPRLEHGLEKAAAAIRKREGFEW